MAWNEREPLKRFLRQQRVVDSEMRRVLLSAAADARRKLVKLEPGTLRRTQLELQEMQLRMWAKLGTVIEDGIRANTAMVANVNITFTDDLLKHLGVSASAEFRRSMMAQANSTIKTYLARQNLGMTLSERVYKNGQVASGRIDRIISNALLRGASAREIARDVGAFINPSTPGGASYAAMRLGRTELNNAFHQASNATYAANPFIDKVDWKLSSSHPHADGCDDLVGAYDPDEVPDKPHPQCLCYTTPRTISDAQLKRRFRSGEFDEWADGELSA